MSKAEKGRAQRDAAAWFARLSQPAITTQALRDFWSWKRDPQNRAAAVHARAGVLATPNPVDPHRAVSWTERRLIFAGAPLAAAVAELNRYTRAKVELEAPDLAAVPVSGVFNTGDVRAFAAALAAEFDLETASGRRGEIDLRPRDGEAR